MNNNLFKIIYELQNPEHEKTYGTNEVITELRNKKREVEQQKPASKWTSKDIELTIKQFHKLDVIMKSIVNLCIGLEKAKQYDSQEVLVEIKKWKTCFDVLKKEINEDLNLFKNNPKVINSSYYQGTQLKDCLLCYKSDIPLNEESLQQALGNKDKDKEKEIPNITSKETFNDIINELVNEIELLIEKSIIKEKDNKEYITCDVFAFITIKYVISFDTEKYSDKGISRTEFESKLKLLKSKAIDAK